MNNEKLTILYERLSHEDGRENESLSIENQKAYLEEYALRSGFKNLVHRTDDGWSGTRWDRPGFLQQTELVGAPMPARQLSAAAHFPEKLFDSLNIEKEVTP